MNEREEGGKKGTWDLKDSEPGNWGEKRRENVVS